MELSEYCWELDDRRLLKKFFVHVDAAGYLADQLFIRHKVTVNFGPEFERPGSDYIIIVCSVRKKDRQQFLEALKELPGKMLLFGYTDYKAYCRSIKKLFDENEKKKSGKINGTDGASGKAE